MRKLFNAPGLLLMFVTLLLFTGSADAITCYNCHGTTASTTTGDYRPVDATHRTVLTGGFQGSHRTHMAAPASPGECVKCHPGSDKYNNDHRDGKIKLSDNINSSVHPSKARYTNSSSALYFNYTSFPQSSNKTGRFALGVCNNVNCHFESITPIWGSDSAIINCNSCHGAPPSDGSHPSLSGSGKNHGNYYGTDTGSCNKCHSDHNFTPGYSHATSAGKRSLLVKFKAFPNLTGVYSGNVSYPEYLQSQNRGRNGSCTNIYCHSNGNRGAPNEVPTWGGTLSPDCTGCHGGNNSSFIPISSSGHKSHVKISFYACAKCHKATVDLSDDRTIIGQTNHVNGIKTLSFADDGSYDSTTKSCSNTYCHGNNTPEWHGSLPGNCTGCHGGDATSSRPISSGKHFPHMNNNSTLGRGNNLKCGECHAKTVGLESNRQITNPANHVNKFKDYSGIKAGGKDNYDTAVKVCSNVYCHSSGQATPLYRNMTNSKSWTGSAKIGCTGCHGYGTRGTDPFVAFTSAAGEPNYTNGGAGTANANSHQKHVSGAGSSDSTGCVRCHMKTVDRQIAAKLRDYSSLHLDKSRDVTFSAEAAGVQARYSSVTKQCLNIYCHSSGSLFDNTTTNSRTMTWGATTTCNSCHANESNSAQLSGKHGSHIPSAIYVAKCYRCHNNTLDAAGNIIDKNLHANRTKDIAFSEGGSYDSYGKGCTNTYCHSNAHNGAPTVAVKWSDTIAATMQCVICHKGRVADSSGDNCNAIQGNWSSVKEFCTPSITMSTNGHERLVGLRWIRKYPCSYCHYDTVDPTGNVKDITKHLNKIKDVVIDPYWGISNKPFPAYSSNSAKMTCYNVYCHSDGTTEPKIDKPYSWTQGPTKCNSCHGHALGTCSNSGCHDGRVDENFKVWTLPAEYLKFGSMTSYQWPANQQWRAAVPMFGNEGAGTSRANSHPRHVQTDFTCDNCHYNTIKVDNGACSTASCHDGSNTDMGEVSHLDAAFHVNRTKDVVFKNGGTYDPAVGSKTCTNTKCHTGTTPPKWGDSINGSIICLSCHSGQDGDVDTFAAFNTTTKAKINLTQWITTGHGRYSTAGRYPVSSNPAANFPANPCWYCHDNTVLHGNTNNPFRLRKHPQFEQRFDKECVYCHMEHKDYECIKCHVGQESLAPQATIGGIVVKLREGGTRTDWPGHGYTSSCTTTAGCHDSDDGTFSDGGHKGHSTGAGLWSVAQKDDIKNQYVMMGVCLQCHDDDSNGQCNGCHASTGKYSLGFNPGTGFIKPKKARASAAHFGRKHWQANQANSSVWKGGKFCWDCHDPHGDTNIYMIQDQVATTTDGRFGIPLTRAAVSFTNKTSGSGYAGAPNRICNVCHGPASKHYLGGENYFSDSHNATKVCTTCHMHRFAESHADSQSCTTCHNNAKPVPKHAAFSLPVTCVKCHAGTIGARANVVSQFNANSHHVQGVTLTGKQCYQCHWEATQYGTIDISRHEGFNYKLYTSIKNARVDLVVWQPGSRPAFYNTTTTAIQFLASNIKTVAQRGEVAKLNRHCLSCHSDQNNDTTPFVDCKTPRQYAWDNQSVDARYSQTGITTWGKVNSGTYPNANRKDTVVKALSAHGNAAGNQGGWNAADGYDATPPNTRNGSQNVLCYDCHNSHGSTASGVTSSYLTFNNTNNGANLKQTVNGVGGYTATYQAIKNTAGKYEAGARQCFDCHETQNAGSTRPWGYQSTYNATQPIMSYDDSPGWAGGTKGRYTRFQFRKTAVAGTHFSASSMLSYSTHERINGLCTPCHDPHGVSPTLGSKMAYAVPLLKGSWMTSPYKEDAPPRNPTANDRAYVNNYWTGASEPNRWGGSNGAGPGGNPTGWSNRRPIVPVPLGWNTDRNTFNNSRIAETDQQFAGLCLRCHQQGKLLDGSTGWGSRDRVHKSVKGWGNNTEHSYTCSKCHQPHSSGLPRLMVTNCFDYQHRGQVPFGGKVSATDVLTGGNLGDVNGGHWGFPVGGSIVDTISPTDANYKADPYKYEATTQCHLRRAETVKVMTPASDYLNRSDKKDPPIPAQWPQENYWNYVTPWPNSAPTSNSGSYQK